MKRVRGCWMSKVDLAIARFLLQEERDALILEWENNLVFPVMETPEAHLDSSTAPRLHRVRGMRGLIYCQSAKVLEAVELTILRMTCAENMEVLKRLKRIIIPP